MEDTKRKGDISEQKAVTKLLELEVDVFTPVGENTRIDLIYEINENLTRVQVKTGRFENGYVAFNCAKVHSNATSNKRTSYKDDVDEFIVYCHSRDELYIVSIKEIPETEMRLRIEKSDSPNASYNRTNWAEDYLLENKDDLLVGIE